MSCPDEILHLVERFQLNLEAYRSGQYNETQLRREFLDPFFSALGWDVENKQGYAEAYKDVIHEDAIKVGGATKAPDYCFRIGGTRKFFVEAKRPSANLKDEISPAYQLRRYAWSAKLPLSILTDFDEFAVYDCRAKPGRADTAATARTLYVEFKEYPERWEEIASIFSREEVLKGSFDRYAESTKAKKGTAEVDDAFLKEIEAWRDTLARTIALRNTELTQRELNFAVQRTIDRMIFLRICEDRGIETYGALMALLNGEHVYKRLCELFHRADEKYNSGLFHFRKEKDRLEEPDELTLGLSIDDKPVKEIIRNLYYPDSPYEFSVLPADILGQVYEQFLGKVIRLTAGHRAVVEDKPEVKKAGGVYYTPTYIVDYIVKNTVGKLLGDGYASTSSRPSGVTSLSMTGKEGERHPERSPDAVGTETKGVSRKSATPKQVSNLHILDPACGSGSFLIGAYQYLLDWHRDWYVNDGAKKWATGRSPVLYQVSGGDWRLTTAERKRILLNNIYGVDIDPQAAEVTKLSLLLKVLEGENEQTISRQLKMFHERALPDLGSNIKCGNSLIGPDFYEGKQLSLMDDEERLRINVFDWKKEFPFLTPSVLLTSPPSQGGDIEGVGFDAVIGNPPYGAEFTKPEAGYFNLRYRASRGARDVYVFFIERVLGLLAEAGRFSFIVPSAWLGGPDYRALRELLLEYRMDRILLLPFDVFKDAYIDTSVLVLSNEKPNEHKVGTFVFGKKEKLGAIDLSDDEYSLINPASWGELEDRKFVLDPHALLIVKRIGKLAKSNFSHVIALKRGVLFDKHLLTKKRSSRASHRYFEGDVYRYQLNLVAPNWVEFDERMKERPKEFKWFDSPRLLLRRLVNRRQRLMATFAAKTFVTNKNLYSVLPGNDAISLLFVLGILNSRLVSYLYINQVTQATKDDFPQVTIEDILKLPFPYPVDKSRHDRMVEMVEEMLTLHK